MTLRRVHAPALALILALIAACSATVTGMPTAAPADSVGTSSAAGPAPSHSPATNVSTSSAPSPDPVVTTVTVTPSAGSNQPVPVPATTVDVTDLLGALTSALNTHDRAEFLTHFSRSAALVAARWWDNLDVAGFDAGSVSVYGVDTPQAALDANGTAVFGSVMAGVHHPYDGVDEAGAPLIPTTQYRMRVRPEADGTVRIVGWQAVRPAPWDCICTLVAVKSEHAVVVSKQSDHTYARSIAAAAEQALSFHRKLFAAVDAPIAAARGTVIYATENERDLRTWFFARGDAVSDVTDIALAYVRDFPAPTGRAAPSNGRTVGGSRVAVGPLASGLLIPVLVHELVHYRFFQEPLNREHLANSPDVAEGIAQYVMEFYMGTSAADLERGRVSADDGVMRPAMTPERIRRLFTGKPPTANNLRTGSAADLDFWYVIAASQYEYIAEHTTVAAAFAAAECAYQGQTVFACAAGPMGQTEQQLVRSWAAWVRSMYG